MYYDSFPRSKLYTIHLRNAPSFPDRGVHNCEVNLGQVHPEFDRDRVCELYGDERVACVIL